MYWKEVNTGWKQQQLIYYTVKEGCAIIQSLLIRINMLITKYLLFFIWWIILSGFENKYYHSINSLYASGVYLGGRGGECAWYSSNLFYINIKKCSTIQGGTFVYLFKKLVVHVKIDLINIFQNFASLRSYRGKFKIVKNQTFRRSQRWAFWNALQH